MSTLMLRPSWQAVQQGKGSSSFPSASSQIDNLHPSLQSAAPSSTGALLSSVSSSQDRPRAGTGHRQSLQFNPHSPFQPPPNPEHDVGDSSSFYSLALQQLGDIGTSSNGMHSPHLPADAASYLDMLHGKKHSQWRAEGSTAAGLDAHAPLPFPRHQQSPPSSSAALPRPPPASLGSDALRPPASSCFQEQPPGLKPLWLHSHQMDDDAAREWSCPTSFQLGMEHAGKKARLMLQDCNEQEV